MHLGVVFFQGGNRQAELEVLTLLLFSHAVESDSL